MIRRIYLPGPEPIRLRSLILPAALTVACTLSLLLFALACASPALR